MYNIYLNLLEIIIMSSDECIEDKTKYVLNQRHSVTLLEDQLKYNEIDIKQKSFENKHNELGTKLNTNNNSNNIKEIKNHGSYELCSPVWAGTCEPVPVSQLLR